MTRIDDPQLFHRSPQKVLEVLTNAGCQAYFVGGTVRNILLGTAVGDYDIATDARPEVVSDLAGDAGLKVVPTGIDHGTVTVVSRGVPVEVTTFRKDVETDGRRARVAYSTDISEDARRRDFTMNALYARADGTLLDPLNGLEDLKAHRVRFIGDPAERICEDFLRILRFFRFTAWYGDPELGIDAEGLAACAELADGLDGLSQERIGHEVLRLLAAPEPGRAVASMDHAGILGRILPGTSSASLAVLEQLESAHDVPVDPIRRLAVLGGDAPGAALRLSKAQSRQWTRLRDGVESADTAFALGHELGARSAIDVLILRGALLGTPVSAQDLEKAHLGASAVFPLVAADLPGHLEGPAIGAALKSARKHWMESEGALPKAALLKTI